MVIIPTTQTLRMDQYQQKAKELVAEMKQIIEVKGIDLTSVLRDSGIEDAVVDQILSGEKIPSLDEFLALCEISGITFKLPSVETPDNPM
jgi:DNA-binding phage protein